MKFGWWRKSKIGRPDKTTQKNTTEQINEGCVQEEVVQETKDNEKVIGLCPYCAMPQNVVEDTTNLCPFCGMPFIPIK